MPVTPPFLKVCGLTNADNAADVEACEVDAIGLNFYPKSKRYVSESDGIRIRQRLTKARVVGVFVNSSVADVTQVVNSVNVDAVQFHGDETVATIAEFYRQCPGTDVIRAYRLNASTLNHINDDLQALRDAKVPLKAVLVDAFVPGEFGGTGHTVDIPVLKQLNAQSTPVILAGGLTPDNVAEIAAASSAWGIDVASGVESRPGMKDIGLVRSFVAAARSSAK